MIHYAVSFENASQHLFDIRMNIEIPLLKGQEFYLPAWIPGSYMVRDFAKNIVSIRAISQGSEVSLIKLDKSTWQIQQEVQSLEIQYQVYAWDMSVRSAHLDNQHGFFNGTSLFLGVKGHELESHSLELQAAEFAILDNWQVATAMTIEKADANGFGKYVSKNYEELIDHPFEMGALEKVEFEVAGVPHKMFFTEAPPRVDWQRIARDVAKICETQIAFFGDEKPPFEQYVFLTFVLKKGFGGLEHRASTALHCSFEDLPLVGESPNVVDDNYRTFLSLCCHEYFHSWNVKRIKPARFIPLDTSQEVHTELLWFFEGITSYYDELLLARAEVIKPESYLDMLARTLTRTFRTQGRFKQTVTESSFDAWTKFYKQDENAVNAIVSYYGKGAMVAFCLDFEIRKLSDNRQSLDDLMRLIWRQYGKSNRGIEEQQVQQICEEFVGVSLEEFFAKALYSLEELDLKPIFDSMGVEFQVIAQYLHNEKGGFVSKPKQRRPVSFLGITHRSHELGVKVTTVVENSCAALAGISNSDIIIAVEDIRVTSAELDKTIAKIPLNTTVSVSYFRRDRLHHTQVELTEGQANTCYLSFKQEQPQQILLDWLGGE